MRLQLLCKLRRLAYAHKQHAGCQRVQRAGMSDLEVLLAEMTDGCVLDFSDHVGRSPSVWFVDGDDNPLRIVLYVSGKRSHIRSKNQSFQTELFTRYLINPALVTSALERLAEPCVCDLKDGLERDESGWHHEHVCIVVLLDEFADLH